MNSSIAGGPLWVVAMPRLIAGTIPGRLGDALAVAAQRLREVGVVAGDAGGVGIFSSESFMAGISMAMETWSRASASRPGFNVAFTSLHVALIEHA